ncbi:hypothetical protein [Pontibacillus litoralis]|uniref:Membrane protein YqhR n=1 Tax=Pontibacillus litoralis JSM 072002 TaxID=1385512 RepID=A0A0A5G3R4_9BACI|nr:hypothetical protein [Pontibacillus litoralis]KGX87761.1 hypothetical protein N784_14210 [Pontibacillus litoralis JSM 072002]
MLRKGIGIGTITGLLLGAILWIAEIITGINVYTLLLNVDFIPIIGRINWPVWIEWIFHLLVSWVLGIIYTLWIAFRTDRGTNIRWSIGLSLSMFAALSYFPLTDWAIKETPPLDDVTAITIWFSAHFIYGIALVKLEEHWNK